MVSQEDILANNGGKKGKKLVVKKGNILNKLELKVNSIRVCPTRNDNIPVYASMSEIPSHQSSPKNMTNIKIPDKPSRNDNLQK